MKSFINNFLLFIQFFTRIPVNKELQCDTKNFVDGSPLFPVVGAIIGGIQYIIYYIFSIKLSSLPVAVLVVFTTILVTGALHLDGFADCADGFFSFKGGKEKIIEIMKDSRIGAYGSIAIVFNILLKVSLISECIKLVDSRGLYVASVLVVGPIMGRFAAIFLSFIGTPAKPQGTGNLFIGKIKKSNILLASIITLGLTYLLMGNISVILFASAIIVSLLVNHLFIRKIGGNTGDTLGAGNETVEICTYLVTALLLA